MKSWIAESDFLFCVARVPRRQPWTRLQALVRENQNATAAGPPSKPEDYHIVNTFFTSLDTVLAEIENRFSGNDQGVICALGGVTLIPPPVIALTLFLDKERPTPVLSIKENTRRKIKKDSGRRH